MAPGILMIMLLMLLAFRILGAIIWSFVSMLHLLLLMKAYSILNVSWLPHSIKNYPRSYSSLPQKSSLLLPSICLQQSCQWLVGEFSLQFLPSGKRLFVSLFLSLSFQTSSLNTSLPPRPLIDITTQCILEKIIDFTGVPPRMKLDHYVCTRKLKCIFYKVCNRMVNYGTAFLYLTNYHWVSLTWFWHWHWLNLTQLW